MKIVPVETSERGSLALLISLIYKYQALKFKLADVAEDYEKAMKLNSTLHLQQANSDVEETVQYRRKLGEHGLGCCIVILCVADLALRMNPQRTKTRFSLSRRV